MLDKTPMLLSESVCESATLVEEMMELIHVEAAA